MRERGAVLVYVLVAALLGAMIAAGALRLAFDSQVLLSRSEIDGRARSLLDAARAQAWTCLYDPALVGRSCTMTTAQRACLPSRVAGRALTFALGGTPPLCTLTITLEP